MEQQEEVFLEESTSSDSDSTTDTDTDTDIDTDTRHQSGLASTMSLRQLLCRRVQSLSEELASLLITSAKGSSSTGFLFPFYDVVVSSVVSLVVCAKINLAYTYIAYEVHDTTLLDMIFTTSTAVNSSYCYCTFYYNLKLIFYHNLTCNLRYKYFAFNNVCSSAKLF